MASRTMKQPVPSSKKVAQVQSRPWVLWLVVLMLVITGIGALPNGWGLITDPSGASLGMSTEWLSAPIFPNFFVPGLFLFSVIGLGSLLVALLIIWRPDWRWAQALNPVRAQHWVWTAAMGIGLALMVWITVQMLSVKFFSWLQPTFFLTGAATMIIMALPAVRRYFKA